MHVHVQAQAQALSLMLVLVLVLVLHSSHEPGPWEPAPGSVNWPRCMGRNAAVLSLGAGGSRARCLAHIPNTKEGRHFSLQPPRCGAGPGPSALCRQEASRRAAACGHPSGWARRRDLLVGAKVLPAWVPCASPPQCRHSYSASSGGYVAH